MWASLQCAKQKILHSKDGSTYTSDGAGCALAKWHELTGDKSALDFGVELGNRLCNSEDNGDDGCLRPDGSFGGTYQESSGSWHGHSHTHCLPALTSLGEQLIHAGRPEEGVRFINQAGKTFDWLYDPTRNPDAGSMTGWLGEWNIVATGWNRKTDAEGCINGDVTRRLCFSRINPAGYEARRQREVL